jgi:hypothetical protein
VSSFGGSLQSLQGSRRDDYWATVTMKVSNLIGKKLGGENRYKIENRDREKKY